MFGWARKSDGFEWHRYVRTTIRLRRKDRRKRLEDIRFSAVAGAKNAAQAGVRAGHSAIGRLLRLLGQIPGLLLATMRTMASLVWRLWCRLGTILVCAVGASRPLISKSGVAPMIVLLTLAVAISAAGSYLAGGWTVRTIALAVAGLLLLAPVLLDYGVRRPAPRLPAGLLDLPRPPGRPWVAGRKTQAAFGLIALASLIAMAVYAYGPPVALNDAGRLLGALMPSATPDKIVVRGRARAITGDTLAIGGRHIRIADIEAPELSQVCRNSRGRRWRCGRRARRALARLVARRTVACATTGSGATGLPDGRCRVGSKDVAMDIGRELVRSGNAFAAGGYFSRYGSLERAARDKRVALWSGIAQRPKEYRRTVWERAKQRAPNGCPIKGRVSSKGKIYLVPWSPGYRRERIDKRRGERWFCSEREALAAGWQPDPAG